MIHNKVIKKQYKIMNNEKLLNDYSFVTLTLKINLKRNL